MKMSKLNQAMNEQTSKTPSFMGPGVHSENTKKKKPTINVKRVAMTNKDSASI